MFGATFCSEGLAQAVDQTPAYQNYASALQEAVRRNPRIESPLADCNKTLITDTINKSTLSISDLSIAFLLNESQWTTLHQQFGADAVIYGIPIGVNYADYQRNLSTVAERYDLHDYERYQTTYASSKLSTNAVSAYVACVAAANNGLAVVAAGVGGKDSYYTVWVRYVPVVNQASSLTGAVTQPVNVSDDSLNTMNQQWSSQHFDQTVDRQFNVVPKNQKAPASLQVSVGATSKVIELPPLQVPELRRENKKGNTFQAAAGWSAGGRPNATQEGCINPTHTKGAFVLGTQHFIIEEITRNGEWKYTQVTPEQICVTLTTSNTSGTNTSVIKGEVTAVEAYLPDQ
jgi:hypothetical protein